MFSGVATGTTTSTAARVPTTSSSSDHTIGRPWEAPVDNMIRGDREMKVLYRRLSAASIGTLVVATMVAAPQSSLAAQTLDQQQTGIDGAFPIGDFFALSPLVAQTFTAGQTGPLSK